MNQQQAIDKCNELAIENPGTQYYVAYGGRKHSVISFDDLVGMKQRPPVMYAAIKKE
jgi:hypothetical protein